MGERQDTWDLSKVLKFIGKSKCACVYTCYLVTCMQVLFIESKNLSPLRSTGKQGQRSREELEQQSKSEDVKRRNYVLTAKRSGLFEIYQLLGTVCCKKGIKFKPSFLSELSIVG